jgi:thiol-disulfide isomerase/thioredoxin
MKYLILLGFYLLSINSFSKELIFINKSNSNQFVKIAVYDVLSDFVNYDSLDLNRDNSYTFDEKYNNSIYAIVWYNKNQYYTLINEKIDTLILEDSCIYKIDNKSHYYNNRNHILNNIDYKSKYFFGSEELDFEEAKGRFYENCERLSEDNKCYYVGLAAYISDFMQFCTYEAFYGKNPYKKVLLDNKFNYYLKKYLDNYKEEYLPFNSGSIFHSLNNMYYYAIHKDTNSIGKLDSNYLENISKNPKVKSLLNLHNEALLIKRFTSIKQYRNYTVDTITTILKEDLPKLSFVLNKYRQRYYVDIKDIGFLDSSKKPITMYDITQKYDKRYLLFEYWSLGCAPCLREIPYINVLDSLNKKPNYEIVKFCQIDSKDSSLIKSKNLLNKRFYDKVNHYYDDGLQKKNLLREFKINAIPFKFLYDREKNVVVTTSPPSFSNPDFEKKLQSIIEEHEKQ